MNSQTESYYKLYLKSLEDNDLKTAQGWFDKAYESLYCEYLTKILMMDYDERDLIANQLEKFVEVGQALSFDTQLNNQEEA